MDSAMAANERTDPGGGGGWTGITIPDPPGFFADDNRVGLEAEVEAGVLRFLESLSRAGAKWVLDEDGLCIIVGRKYHGMETNLAAGESIKFRALPSDYVEIDIGGIRFGVGPGSA